MSNLFTVEEQTKSIDSITEKVLQDRWAKGVENFIGVIKVAFPSLSESDIRNVLGSSPVAGVKDLLLLFEQLATDMMDEPDNSFVTGTFLRFYIRAASSCFEYLVSGNEDYLIDVEAYRRKVEEWSKYVETHPSAEVAMWGLSPSAKEDDLNNTGLYL